MRCRFEEIEFHDLKDELKGPLDDNSYHEIEMESRRGIY